MGKSKKSGSGGGGGSSAATESSSSGSDQGESNSDAQARLQEQSYVTSDLGQTGDIFHVASLYFPTSSAELDAQDGGVLDAVAAEYDAHMRAGSEGSLTIDGYADYRGEEEDNQGLSGERADAVEGDLASKFNFAPEFEATGMGEGEEGGDKALQRRVDVLADIKTYDESKEEEDKEALLKLPAMLSAVIPVLVARGGPVSQRAARYAQQLLQPGVDDSVFDQGTVRKYILKDEHRAGIEPEDVAQHAMEKALAACRHSDGDIEEFATSLEQMSVALFVAIHEVFKLYNLSGEEYKGAGVLNEWIGEKQRDPNTVIYAHRQ